MLICLIPPHSYTILPRWKPNAAQKDVRDLRNYLWPKLQCKSGRKWASMGGLLRNYPLTNIAMKEWAAMGCNGRTFEELPPDQNCHVIVGCNGLQGEKFWGINHRDLNCHVRAGCNGLQWEDFWRINSWLKFPCKNGLQCEDLWGFTPLTKLPC